MIRLFFPLILFSFSLTAFSQDLIELTSDTKKEIISQLDSIHFLDQKYREQSIEIANEYGYDSQESMAIWDSINYYDSINVIKVTDLIDKFGWLGASVVGEKGNKTIWLVIQHADSETQEKYLPIMQESVAKGETKASYLALMEDRLLLAQGKKQIYGSQLKTDQRTGEIYVLPIEDPDNVDKRRVEVGLEPLSEYLKFWNLDWDVDEHKKIPDMGYK